MNAEQVIKPATFNPETWSYSLHVIRYGAPVSEIWLKHCRYKGAELERRWVDEDMPSLHHLELVWPAREPRELHYGSLVRSCVVWGLVSHQRITDAVCDAASIHVIEMGQPPVYGFIRRLPVGIEEPAEIEIPEAVDPVALITAGWMPDKFIVLFR